MFLKGLKMEYEERLKKLGQNIRIAREERNITIKALSEKTGIRAEYLKKIEKGEAVRIKISKLYQIAHAMSMKTSMLLQNL